MNDTYGRAINYLRLSITDRCNLRCSYCMPDGIDKLGCHDILRFEELFRIVDAASTLGIRKVRLTGGEPLVRKGVTDFIAMISELPDIDEVTLTTNGMLLPGRAKALKQAGIERLNVSLDSLDPANFARITGCGDLAKVMRGLDEAEEAGMAIKLNMVVMRGLNDHEIIPFAELSQHKSWSIRYIEYMPTTHEQQWQTSTVPCSEILERLMERFDMSALPRRQRSGPARPYRIEGAPGTIGLISPMSDHFCSSCNRIRVTSTGTAKGCLLSNSETDLKPALEQDDQEQLVKTLESVIAHKPAGHTFNCDPYSVDSFSMASIGG